MLLQPSACLPSFYLPACWASECSTTWQEPIQPSAKPVRSRISAKRRSGGWIMSRVTSDSERIAQLVTWGMLDVTGPSSTWDFNVLHGSPQLAAITGCAGHHPDTARRPVYFKTRILRRTGLVRKLNSKSPGVQSEFTGVRVVKGWA